MRFPPPEIVSTWPQPNYVNPVERGPTLMIIQFIFLPLTVAVVGLRMYVRARVIRKVWWDDWCMVAALVFAIGVTTCVVLATAKYGWDIHIWDLQPDLAKPSRQVSIAGQSLFLGASGLTKISILVSYLRIAVNRTFLHSIYASMGVCILWVVVFTIVLWTQCIPISSYWSLNPTTTRHCIPEGPPMMAQTILTIITDTLVYLLPMPILWGLHLPAKQRIGLLTLFALGAFVCIAGIMRTYYAHQVIYKTYDVTWIGYDLWIWTALETDLGVIGGSIPALKPLLFGRGDGSKGGRVKGGDRKVSMNRSTKSSAAFRSTTKMDDEVQITLHDWSESGHGESGSELDAAMGGGGGAGGGQRERERERDTQTQTQTGLSFLGDDLIRPVPLRSLSAMTMKSQNTWMPPSSWEHQSADVDDDMEAQRPAGVRSGPQPLLDEI